MILHVVEATYDRDYIIRLKFNDGAEGFVNLEGELYGEMFSPLKEIEAFKAFRVDPAYTDVVLQSRKGEVDARIQTQLDDIVRVLTGREEDDG